MNEPIKMIIERDLAITMTDGVKIRADVFRPPTDAKVPVIMSLGPYGKGIAYKDGYGPEWEWLISKHPEILEGSSGTQMVWETVDPERWVPDGYAVIRVDSRGTGRSPGLLDLYSPREVQDYYEAIEWAGTQPWSSGKVGLCGVSYYAINQWLVAQLQPPHLAAILPWDGLNDHYRELAYHGGILSNGFFELWYPGRVLRNQHGKGTEGVMDSWLNEPAAGPETLSEEELAQNRADFFGTVKVHNLDDAFHRSRSADFAKITVPILSAANWEGCLHPRGNFAGFTESASTQKWLEVHGGRHEERFYEPDAIELQKRFMAYFLKDEDNGWQEEAPVLLYIRHPGERFELRREYEWPLARTEWTELQLDVAEETLSWEPVRQKGQVTFDALGEGITLFSAPLTSTMEITGPLVAKLFIASSTVDADLFVTLRGFTAMDEEITFQGTLDPAVALAHGWLRASHRKLDATRSKPFQPYHSHDELLPLNPGEVYELDVEIWPTCIVLEPGSRIALTIAGRDFARGATGLNDLKNHGSGPFVHNDPDDRPSEVFGGSTTLYTGPEYPSSVLLPIIPAGD